MDFADALAYLDGHINYQDVPRAGRLEGVTLAPMVGLVTALGDPQDAYPVIHITGTNGKGSSARMVTRLLAEAGLSVGTYTSPHLERYTERIRWNDAEVSEDAFAAAIENVARVEPLLARPPTHFEALTAAALTHFADIAVDVAVVEVGMLGRFDATNVVDADVAVVTNIGRDHTDGVGDWRRAIAHEKAGIITPKSVLVLGERDPELEPVFLAEGPEAVWRRGADFDCDGSRLAVGGRVVTLRTPFARLEDVFVPLHGEHQGDNAAISLAATEAFFDRALEEDIVRQAFAAAEVPGRLEVCRRQPLVVLDGAHNPDGAAAAARALDEEFTTDGRRTLVVGMLGGRDPRRMLEALGAARFDQVITCAPQTPRAQPAEELAEVALSLGTQAQAAPTVEAALTRALAGAEPEDFVLVAGSLYVVGAARAALTS